MCQEMKSENEKLIIRYQEEIASLQRQLMELTASSKECSEQKDQLISQLQQEKQKYSFPARKCT